MNPWMTTIIAFIAGLAFGLLVAWGTIPLLVAGIGAGVLLLGAVFLGNMRYLFAFAIAGFMAAYVAAGGLTLL